MIEAAKGILLKYIPDVFILTDHRKGPASGLSPGFGITLTAETINGTFNRTIRITIHFTQYYFISDLM
jgi:RNA 3'-terminal phosphate cyclase-like protein